VVIENSIQENDLKTFEKHTLEKIKKRDAFPPATTAPPGTTETVRQEE
jgi:hypothetical protein